MPIYALGDVCDKGYELTPVAIAAGRKLSDRVFGGQSDACLVYDQRPSSELVQVEMSLNVSRSLALISMNKRRGIHTDSHSRYDSASDFVMRTYSIVEPLSWSW